tara:strand:+ start:512 stop:2968 length:2457 start_codon:yes stop_codon:yes gene_type:complete
MKFKILFFILFFPFVFSSQISGIAKDDFDKPLEYATVSLFNALDSTLVTGKITNKNGEFEIDMPLIGNYYIKCSFVGFQSAIVPNILINKKSSNIELSPISLSLGEKLNEVTIDGEKSIFSNKMESQSFNADQFENSIGGTALDVIRNLPSVNINIEGDISLRGSNGIIILIDGKLIQGDPNNLIAQIPANSMDKIELITSPSSKYDSEGKSGMINIITKKGKINGTYFQVNTKGGFPSVENYGNDVYHQRYAADFTLNKKTDKLNLSMSISYLRNDLGGRRIGEVYTVENDTTRYLNSVGERSFDKKNINGRFDFQYELDSSNQLHFGLFAGKRKKDRLADITYNNYSLENSNSLELNPFQYFNHNLRTRAGDFALGSFDYNHVFKNKTVVQTSFLMEYTLLGGPTINQNISLSDPMEIYQDEYNTNNNPLLGTRINVDYSNIQTNLGNLEFGYQFRNLNHEGNFNYERKNPTSEIFELVSEFSSEVNLQRTIHSTYGMLVGNKSNWNYNFGMRVEQMNRELELKDKSGLIDTSYSYNFLKPFPTAIISYDLNPKSKIKFTYTKRVQRTTTFKMNPFPEREHSETLEQGDPNLLPEFVDNIEIGYDNSFSNKYSFFSNLFFRKTNNLINRVNTVYNDSILNRIYSNVGNSTLYGLELGLQLKPIKKWSNYFGGNVFYKDITGEFDNRLINTNALIYSFNCNSTFKFNFSSSIQFGLNYLSQRITAQGEDSRFYLPSLTFKKSFLDNSLVMSLQWLNMDLGLINSNEQRITTSRENSFFTTTNYVYEVDIFLLNLSYNFNKTKSSSNFIKSEFGEREF